MGNLGLYQWMTETAKKVGGPVPFFAAIGGAGYAVIRVAEAGVKKVYHHVKGNHEPLNKKNISPIMTVSAYAVNDNGVEFKIGDQIRILASINDGVLIEKIGDPKSPYIISNDFLKRILKQ